MDGKTINSILRSDPFTLKCFGGVLTLSEKDQWPQPLKLPVSYVINTDVRKDGPGEHWVALYCAESGGCDYFDSYGTPPLEGIYDFVKRFSSGPVLYNTKWVQSPLSRVCGAYAVFFLLMRSRGITMQNVGGLFQNGKNLMGNDALLIELLAGD